MKYAPLAALALALYLPQAGAVDLNKDALKSMQQKGHEMLEENKEESNQPSTHALSLASGQCLQDRNPGKPGAALAVGACKNGANNQQWYFDQGALVAKAGHCVMAQGKDNTVAKTQACNGSPAQKWHQDGKGRLNNGSGQCLELKQGKLHLQGCSDAANQAWKKA